MFTAITVTRTFMRVLVASGMASDRWWFGVHRPTPPAPVVTGD
jgi:hypothetical protein